MVPLWEDWLNSGHKQCRLYVAARKHAEVPPSRAPMFLNDTVVNRSKLNFIEEQPTTSTWNWTSLPLFIMTDLCLNLILTAIVLSHFVGYRHLRTSFAVCLINLLIANSMSAVLRICPNVLANVLTKSWTALGDPICSLSLYGNSTIGGGIMMSHALITANRIWALFAPLSYR